ncbi:NAD-dependent epimerase/dehydratase family protein [Skermania sp. ID1734]|uniref:SDR family oxidoreductase n=1 Tax=Skermania sp. ID1734 TaxID=2597516 RepID=UPI00117D833E|nr:NAD(P)H-binding protein [Skermania sp. ID1734]TSE00441.1 NAD-dependent epimerase/dehydratase family protein [Skermania sp. ID1734]
MKIAVAGGTGMTGSLVVDRLRTRGHDVVVLARAAGVDLVTGDGLADKLSGIDTVVDATSIVARKASDYVHFFGSVASNLQSAGAAAGVRRIVTLSIVGIDGLGGGPFAHYDGKNAQEKATLAGSVPTTILRATQFHGFAGQLIDWTAKGGLLPCPKQPCQPIDVAVVADRLADLATTDESNPHVRLDIAGPEVHLMRDLVRRTAAARGQKLIVIPVWLPGKTAKAIRNGALTAPKDATILGGTFDEWLARTYPR